MTLLSSELSWTVAIKSSFSSEISVLFIFVLKATWTQYLLLQLQTLKWGLVWTSRICFSTLAVPRRWFCPSKLSECNFLNIQYRNCVQPEWLVWSIRVGSILFRFYTVETIGSIRLLGCNCPPPKLGCGCFCL